MKYNYYYDDGTETFVKSFDTLQDAIDFTGDYIRYELGFMSYYFDVKESGDNEYTIFFGSFISCIHIRLED